MMRKLAVGLGLAALAGLSGCLDSTTVVTVDKTGAGTVVQTAYMSKTAQDMMSQMMAGMTAGQSNAPAIPKNMMLEDNAKYQARAAGMGEGVTFVSAKELTKPDGSLGSQVTYAFTDIAKLRLDTEPEPPKPGNAPAPAKKAKRPTTFAFTKGATPTLTITNPRDPSAKPAAKTPEVAKEPAPQELAQMRQMFDGFRVRIVVKVDGEIVKSNAAFVEKDPATGKSQTVTLVDMDVGALLKDDAALKKLIALGPMQDMATAQEKMKDMPGLRFEPADKVTIEFK